MQKIKNALTPGHHRHQDATGGNVHRGVGGYGATETNVTEVPPGGTATVPGGAVNVIVHAPGEAEVLAGQGVAAGGMGGMSTTGLGGNNLGTSSMATSTTSASDYEARAYQQNVGAMGAVGQNAVVHENVGAEICNRQEYVEVEDRPVLKERVERIVEHQPVEKRFIVETRPAGETLLTERVHVESAGVTERIIDRAEGTVCPTGMGTGMGTGVGTGRAAGGATIVDSTTTYRQ